MTRTNKKTKLSQTKITNFLTHNPPKQPKIPIINPNNTNTNPTNTNNTINQPPTNNTIPNNTDQFSTNIIQINLQKRQDATHSLIKDLKPHELALLQEPALWKGKVPGVNKSHKAFTPISSTARPRVSILLPHDLARNTMQLSKFCNPDIIVLRIKINNSYTIILASIYMDITKPIPSKDITDITKYATHFNLPLIIGTDSNAHHTLWGSSNINHRGTTLCDTLSTNNLTPSNTGTIPTFRNHIGSSVIDITLMNCLATSFLDKWKVDRFKSISDHERIRISLNIGNRTRKLIKLTKKCDWLLYHSLVQSSLSKHPYRYSPITTLTKLDINTDFITKVMTDAFDKACPTAWVTNKTKTPWWNAEIEEHRAQLRSLTNRVHKHKTTSNLSAKQAAKHNLNRSIKVAKRASWRNYCANLTNLSDLAKLPKILGNNNKSGNLNSITDPQGALTNTPLETLKVLADELIPQDGFIPTLNSTTGDFNIINKIVDFKRLDLAMSELQKLKAPGPDGISNEMLISAWDLVKAPLRNIMYHSLSLGITPTSWHYNTGAIISKPNKSDYSNPRAFRIISLTSCIQKLMERVILWYLEHEQKIPQALSKNQFGFRRGSGTEAALHALTRNIEDAISNNSYAIGIFLDIEGAFDNIAFDSINKALLSAGIPTTIAQWISHMTSNRHITLKFNDTSHTVKATKGCAQGGVLSPLLWNITLNSLFNLSNIDNDFIQAFADDLAIIIPGTCRSTMRSIANSYLSTIDKWCRDNGLKLSVLKTTAMLFTRKMTTFSPLRINGTNIEYSDTVKYLGVTLDSKLTWLPHINLKLSQATKLLFSTKCCIGKQWGINPGNMRWLYLQVILPILTYGAIVWSKALENNNSLITKLASLQRLATLSITGGKQTTATANLDIMAGIQPLHLTIKQKAITTAVSLKINNKWIGNYYPGNTPGIYTSHAYFIDKFLKSINSFSLSNLDTIPQLIKLNRTYNTFITDRPTIKSLISNQPTHYIQVFTDGSNLSGKCGAGIVIYKDTITIHQSAIALGIGPTISQCEIYAILQAAKWLNDNSFNNETINIFSDSQTAIYALTAYKIDSKLTSLTIDTLNSLANINTINLYWVPGHEDVTGNEQADKLAKLGAIASSPSTETIIFPSIKRIKSEIQKHFHSKHIVLYGNTALSEKGKTPLLILLKHHQYNLTTLNKQALRLLTTLLSGHNDLNYFKFKQGLISTPWCDHCTFQLETTEHFLCKCPAYSHLRYRYFERTSTTMTYIISTCKPHSIIYFTKATKRFEE